jgi:tetratricopeptide (TPR) repeat protein
MVEETTVQDEHKGGKRRFALGFIAASALWVVLAVVVIQYWEAPVYRPPASAPAARQLPAPSAIIHDTPGARQSVAALVAQRLASLQVPARKAILPSDLAWQAEAAIKHGDFATASRIAGAVLASSKLTGWGFYPFDSFMDTIVGPGNDPQLEGQLREWRGHDPQSALAYLISAQYFKTTGWTVRGGDDGNEVPAKDMRLFADDLATAAGDARESITLNPHIPWSYLLLLRTVSGNGQSAPVEAVFQQAVHAFPTYYEPYRQRLYTLTPKWGGSVQAMYAFVRYYAGRAPASSPLKLLYLQLYGYLADAAWVNCQSLDGAGNTGCMQTQMSGMVSRDMGSDMLQALRIYKASDPIAYSNALWPILGAMVTLPRSNDWSGIGAVLQMAGSVMGSDEQLSDKPRHNNYALDDINARIWAQIGNSNNVEQKFGEAISDIEHTTFASEALKDQALAAVYDDMMAFAEDNRQWVNLIAYQAAANAIGGSNHSDVPWNTCLAYHALKLPDEAVKECTHVIDSDGNYMEAHYYRALTYEVMHDWDHSLADFAPIADGAYNWYRVGAAQDMSYIYGEKHDYAAELASLNEHAYLFDPALQNADDLAVSFNNRCYAYMQLGHLHKALADCTASLKYGHIPDAYHKQLELMERLGIKTTL